MTTEDKSMAAVVFPRLSEDGVHFYLDAAINSMKVNKPNDRSELDRRYAILITEMEKFLAIYSSWIHPPI